jgi:hypothetical protein
MSPRPALISRTLIAIDLLIEEESARKAKVMRALFLCLMLSSPILAGCDALTHQDGDSFEAAGVTPAKFDGDDQNCRMQAADYVSYDLHGMSGTHYDQNRAFNAVYSRCMRALGYRPRPYFKNLLPG